jgi:hypothetical protein
MEKEGAALACLITLEEPTRPMKKDAKSAGIYDNAGRGIRRDKIRIVRVQEILHHPERIDLAMHPDATTKARRDAEGDQLRLDLRPARTEIAEAKKPAESVIAQKHRSAKKRNSR